MPLDSTVALGVAAVALAAFGAIGIRFGRARTVEDYVTARDSVGGVRLTATLVASVMGVWILFAVPEAGAAFGGLAAILGYAIGEAIPMLAFARLGPRIREAMPEGHTLAEYARARYGPAMWAFVLGASLFYMFIFLAAELTGIASAFSLVADVPRWQTALLVAGGVLLYTGYGGLRASVVTDAVQAAFVAPLLLLALVGALFALGGPVDAFAAVAREDPSLLNPGFLTGLQFGLWVAIAVVGAELVDQAWWQRVYAAEASGTLRKAFNRAAVGNFLVVLLAGLFGLLARGHADIVLSGEGRNASIALFVLLQETFPDLLVFAVVLLALLLVASTADSLFNAIASLVTTELPRAGITGDRPLWTGARVVTALVALAALLVSLRARSVLQLFLLADLVGAAVAVPLVAGLFSMRVPERGALTAALVSLGFGAVFLPTTNAWLAAVLPTPTPSFLVAFVGTAVISTVLTGLATAVSDVSADRSKLAAVGRLD